MTTDKPNYTLIGEPTNYALLVELEKTDPLFLRIGRLHIATRTRVRRLDDSTFAIRYRQTDIVLVHSDDTFTLFTEEGRKQTTLRRIKRWTPLVGYFLHQGMRIDRSGQVITSTEGKRSEPSDPPSSSLH